MSTIRGGDQSTLVTRHSSEARRLGALIGDQAVEGAQLHGEAVYVELVAPPSGGAQREAAGACEAHVGGGGVEGVQHSLEVADALAHGVFEPGHGGATA